MDFKIVFFLNIITELKTKNIYCLFAYVLKFLKNCILASVQQKQLNYLLFRFLNHLGGNLRQEMSNILKISRYNFALVQSPSNLLLSLNKAKRTKAERVIKLTTEVNDESIKLVEENAILDHSNNQNEDEKEDELFTIQDNSILNLENSISSKNSESSFFDNNESDDSEDNYTTEKNKCPKTHLNLEKRNFNEQNSINYLVCNNCDKLFDSQVAFSEKKQTCLDCNSFLNQFVQNKEENLLISLALNGDGAPMTSSKSYKIWPIIGTVLELDPSSREKFENLIFLGLWINDAQPNYKIFYSKCLEKLDFLMKRVLVFDNKKFKIRIQSLIFDLPAKASALNIKQFNGEYGCIACYHKGLYSHMLKTRIYPPQDLILKTKNDYEKFSQIAENLNEPIFGIYGKSCLHHLISIPEQVPFDYMHLVLSGNPLPLLKNILPDSYWYLLCLYVFSIRVLYEPVDTAEEIDKAKKLFDIYFKQIENFFGQKACTYTLHAHNHLFEQVKYHGALKCHSQCVYEGPLFNIKNLIKGSHGFFHQEEFSMHYLIIEKTKSSESVGQIIKFFEYETKIYAIMNLFEKVESMSGNDFVCVYFKKDNTFTVLLDIVTDLDKTDISDFYSMLSDNESSSAEIFPNSSKKSCS
ncbi:hypothetical protein BpHYR1_052366 [Brachionus plicatilis]|uniref:Uncharacterized protein n=1 Tax=Brachionus plicatilis TaxID=10195 RepID=A0A3M7QRV1_BRAPC|nr:hypothetical protein BpHYR1_052366 [Brachionus plicatilis]